MQKSLQWFHKLKQIIYPRKCTLCNTILDQLEVDCLCGKCSHYLLKEHTCPKCGRPYHLGKERCLVCEQLELKHIERIIALFPYKEVCRESVLRWKYKGIRQYARSYASLFINEIGLLDKIQVDGLIPVPLAPNRLRKRGFNQALDLANEMSILTGIPVYDCLERTKKTKPQSQCSREERLKNIIGSIKIKKNKIFYPELKQVAIIDDIYTTGATIKECVRVIRESLRLKNDNVYVIVVCIGK
ncbi:ComF family protein [Cellulosilyticum ruminicola]|uniref:ComF family protein n=1 Tax=Cellulosilyticum ruminicola TaxID=425254 RepID=UPI0006CF3264|nr:ComF family protein [Cellulosilyticum ruminicola]